MPNHSGLLGLLCGRRSRRLYDSNYGEPARFSDSTSWSQPVPACTRIDYTTLYYFLDVRVQLSLGVFLAAPELALSACHHVP